jgi:hypothetical protein
MIFYKHYFLRLLFANGFNSLGAAIFNIRQIWFGLLIKQRFDLKYLSVYLFVASSFTGFLEYFYDVFKAGRFCPCSANDSARRGRRAKSRNRPR